MKDHRSERPLIVSAADAAEIRREKKFSFAREIRAVRGCREVAGLVSWQVYLAGHPEKAGLLLPACPYGHAGDLLWVREPWDLIKPVDDSGESWISWFDQFLAGPCPSADPGKPWIVVYKADPNDWLEPWPWRTPMSMPVWVSRLSLRVTKVDVSRIVGKFSWVVDTVLSQDLSDV